MKTVILLRHAKSDWNDMSLRDFDRPLNGRGERAAALMGSWAKREALRFDRIVASPAARVKDTFGKFVESYGPAPEPVWDKRVYLASAATIADVIAEADDAEESVLLVGIIRGWRNSFSTMWRTMGHRACATMSRRNSRRLPLRCWIFRSSIGGSWRTARPGQATATVHSAARS